ncbi:MAG: hypothetical protein AAFU65_12515 [Pseudomonadota bacterium]
MSLAAQRLEPGHVPFDYIEIDVDRCTRTFGTAPCTAAGSTRCFNTFVTCQDTPNFEKGAQTLRFFLSGPPVVGLDGLGLLQSVSNTEALIKPGGVAISSSVRCVLADVPHSDVGIDPYLSTRGYDPFFQGTFWGKFLRRNKYLRGRALRWYTGFLTSPFDAANFEVRHFVIESVVPASTGQTVTIRATDVLQLASDDTAQVPVATTGELQAVTGRNVAAAPMSACSSPVVATGT